MKGKTNQMTKSDLVAEVSQAIGPRITKLECGIVVDTLISSIKEALQKGESIEIREFGSFKVRSRKARVGQNPRTGETVAIPARRVPVFTPSKIFCNRVDQGNT